MNHYVTRGDIEEKVLACMKAGGIGAIVGVNAPGGLGKTELAKHVSALLEYEFGKNYLWIDVGERDSAQVIDALSLKLNISLPANPTYETKKNELQYKLMSLGKVMIVFDDVRNAAKTLLEELQAPPNCAILITSRIVDIHYVRETFPLHHMTLAQSRELFEAILGEAVFANESKEIDELAEKCKYNSLIMDNAARRIRQETDAPHPVRDYLDRIQHFGAIKIGGEEVIPVFDVSYNDLSAEDQKRFRSLAVFHPTGFSPNAAAYVWNVEEQDAYAVIERFRNLSLIMRTSDKQPRYRLHDLWDEYASEKLNNSPYADLSKLEA